MSREIIKQPNGKYCIFCSVDENVTHYNCEPREIIDMWTEEAKKAFTIAVNERVERLEKGKKIYLHEKNYIEILERIKEIHGNKEAEEVKKTNRKIMNKEQKIKNLIEEFEQRLGKIKNGEDEFDLEKQLWEIDNQPLSTSFVRQNHAQIRLIKFMALPEFNGDHVFDWENYEEEKHCLYLCEGVWNNVLTGTIKHFLAFQTKEKAELFLKRYKSIMDDYKPLA